MATGSIDLNDIPFIFVFSFAAAANLGVFVLPLPAGISLTDSIWTIGSGQGALTITIAVVGSILALAATFYTNQLDYSSMKGVEYWIVIATVGLVLAAPFQVIINTLLPVQTAAFGAWCIQSIGVLALSYSG